MTNDAELKSALALVREHDVGKQFDMTIIAPDTSEAQAAAQAKRDQEAVEVDDVPVTNDTETTTKATTTKSGYSSGMYTGRFESIARLGQT